MMTPSQSLLQRVLREAGNPADITVPSVFKFSDCVTKAPKGYLGTPHKFAGFLSSFNEAMVLSYDVAKKNKESF